MGMLVTQVYTYYAFILIRTHSNATNFCFNNIYQFIRCYRNKHYYSSFLIFRISYGPIQQKFKGQDMIFTNATQMKMATNV